MRDLVTNRKTVLRIGSIDDTFRQLLEHHVVQANERFREECRCPCVQSGLLTVRACQRLIEHQEPAQEDEEYGSNKARE